MICLLLPQQVGDLGQVRLVHQQLVGELRRDRVEASSRLAARTARRLGCLAARDQRGKLLVGLGQVNDVGLTLQQRGHGGAQLVAVDRLVRVEPPHVAAQVGMRRGGVGEVRGPGYLAEVDLAVHGRQHQVACLHPAQEPVELLQPLRPVGIRLVLVGGLDRLLQLVVVGTRDQDRRAATRSARRSRRAAIIHKVEPVDVGPAHHPARSCGVQAPPVVLGRRASSSSFSASAVQPLGLRCAPVRVELDALAGQPPAQVRAPVSRSSAFPRPGCCRQRSAPGRRSPA